MVNIIKYTRIVNITYEQTWRFASQPGTLGNQVGCQGTRYNSDSPEGDSLMKRSGIMVGKFELNS